MKNIRKLTIFSISIVALIVSVRCGGNDDNTIFEPTVNNSIEPPSWIYGAWQKIPDNLGFYFSSSEIIIAYNIGTNVGSVANTIKDGNIEFTEITKTTTKYSFNLGGINSDGTVDLTYAFTHNSSDDTISIVKNDETLGTFVYIASKITRQDEGDWYIGDWHNITDENVTATFTTNNFIYTEKDNDFVLDLYMYGFAFDYDLIQTEIKADDDNIYSININGINSEGDNENVTMSFTELENNRLDFDLVDNNNSDNNSSDNIFERD